MKRNLLKNDQVSGLIWFFLGIALCIASFKIDLGYLYNPGPGFLPFLSGALLGLLGLILIFSTILNKLNEVQVKKISLKKNQKKLILSFFILFNYIILFQYLGFFLSTFLFFFLLFKLTEPKRWLAPLVLSACSIILSYLIFSVWLNCHLPGGIFGF